MVVSLPVLLILGGRGAMWVGTAPDRLSPSSASSSSSSAVCFKVGMLFQFLINGEALFLTGLSLNMVHGSLSSTVGPMPSLFP